jgi:predicted RNA-binding protein YlqC (UPF0109 family)
METLKQLVELVTINLVDHPTDCKVEYIESDVGLYINIITNDDDKRRIIGKKGNNIQALRTLVHSMAARNRLKTYVTLIE